MRARVLVLSLLAACSGNSLEGKSWSEINLLPHTTYGYVLDGQSRVVHQTMLDNLLYQLDADADAWEEIGPGVGELISTFSSGGIVYQHVRGTPSTPSTVYRLDDRTLTHLADVEQNFQAVPAPGGSGFVAILGGSTMTIRRFDGTSWTDVAMLDGNFEYAVDNKGRAILIDTVTHVPTLIADLTSAPVPLYSCAGVTEQYCKGSPQGFFTDGSGNMTFFVRNDIIGSAFYRLPAGSSTPTRFAELPPPKRPNGTFPHSYKHDADGNGYLVHGLNDGTTLELYYRDAGSSSWDEIIEWPGGDYTPFITPGGTVFALPGGIAHAKILR